MAHYVCNFFLWLYGAIHTIGCLSGCVFFGLLLAYIAMGKQTAICFGFCVHGGIND